MPDDVENLNERPRANLRDMQPPSDQTTDAPAEQAPVEQPPVESRAEDVAKLNPRSRTKKPPPGPAPVEGTPVEAAPAEQAAVEQPPAPQPPQAALRRIQPPRGATQSLSAATPGRRAENGVQPLTPRPPRGAVGGVSAARPPQQRQPTPAPPAPVVPPAAPKPPAAAKAPSAPLTDAQREDLSEVYRQVLAYAARYPGHPSADQALEAAREIGLLLR